MEAPRNCASCRIEANNAVLFSILFWVLFLGWPVGLLVRGGAVRADRGRRGLGASAGRGCRPGGGEGTGASSVRVRCSTAADGRKGRPAARDRQRRARRAGRRGRRAGSWAAGGWRGPVA